MIALGVRTPPADEAGVSMVEVIVYSAVTALVLTAVGGLFYAGVRTQATLGGMDAATGAADVVSNSLQAGIRNASVVSVSEGNTLLKARVAVGSSGWQCVAWKLLAGEKKLVYKAAPEPITSTDYSTWAVLAAGAGAGVDGDAFGPEGDGTLLSYSLTFTSGSVIVPAAEAVTVPLAGAVRANASGTGSPESCWG